MTDPDPEDRPVPADAPDAEIEVPAEATVPDDGRFRGGFELEAGPDGLRVNAAVDGARSAGVRMLRGFAALTVGVVALLGAVAAAAVAAWAYVNGR